MTGPERPEARKTRQYLKLRRGRDPVWLLSDIRTNRGSDAPHDISIFAALVEQLGLRLDSAKAMIDTIVVDHAEKPSAN